MNEFFDNEFSKQIWIDSYKLNTDNSIEDTFKRVAYSIFKDEPEKTEKLYNALIEHKISLGGRIIANVGSGLKNVSFFNCYGMQRTIKPYDSIKCIYSDLSKAAEILKTEGGIGEDFSHIRPKGTLIKGVGVGSPGVIEFMKMFSKSAGIITKGADKDKLYQLTDNDIIKSKIRKGAQIGILDIHHPEIINFITSKQKPNNGLEYFNISVKITDDFMKAVEKDEDWELWFPDIHFEKYDDEWNGDFIEWKNNNYPRVIYQIIKAKEIWNMILQSAYNRAEPGILFIDNFNKYNNLLHKGMKITGTNPCGELPMIGNTYTTTIDNKEYIMQGDICNLGHLNLTAFYNKEKGFDFEDFKDKIKLLIETLDKLIDISYYVFSELENSAKLRRKLGAGILGYGSLLYMMGLKYGSKKALNFTHKLMSIYVNEAYQKSALLAKEYGKFALYDEDIIKDGFIKNSGVLTEETIDLIKKYGLRNSQLLTIAPTGNTGIFQNNASGGLEPVFSKEYIRWFNISHKFDEIKQLYSKIEFPDFENGEYKETKDFYWDKQGDEPVLKSKDGNFIIDKTRGLVKKEIITDYGYKWCKNNLSEEEIKEREKNNIFVTTSELTVKDHVDTMITFSKYIDNSISKTINLPYDYKFEDFDKMFFELWENGVRGITVYREGTMTAVLEKKEEKSEPISERIIKNSNEINIIKKELYSEESAIRYIVYWKKIKVYVIVVYDTLDGVPLEIFAQLPFEAGFDANGQFNQTLFLERLSYWNLISRLLSILFRYNIPIEEIKEQLQKSSYSISSLSGMLMRVLKKFPLDDDIDKDFEVDENITIDENDISEIYEQINSKIKKCPVCNEQLILQEGCFICPNCGYSKCG